jgi:hypothetical protein
MIPVPVMVATVAESVAILATAAAAQPSKSAEICASVAHWPMRSLILVAISISLKPAPAPTIMEPQQRSHPNSYSGSRRDDPWRVLASIRERNVHPKEEGNQESSDRISHKVDQAFSENFAQEGNASANERDIMRASGRRIVVSTAVSEGCGAGVNCARARFVSSKLGSRAAASKRTPTGPE